MISLHRSASLQLKKILSSKEQINEVAKNLILPIHQKRNSVVLNLLSKTIGISPNLHQNGAIPQVLEFQKKLSEITDMMYTSHLLHQRVLNFDDVPSHEKTKDLIREIHTSNCLSILIGDQLLANASRGLAEMRKPLIFEWMAIALEDFSSFSLFIEEKLDLSQPECILKNIEQRCHLSGGSLLGNSCRSTALLAGYSLSDNKDIFNIAFDIGKNIGITFQLQDLLNTDENKLGNLKSLSKQDTTNYLKKVLDQHITNCLLLFDKLPKCEAIVNLKDIVVTIANTVENQLPNKATF